jgi:lipopolysaccharide transport system ATP-binding protein
MYKHDDVLVFEVSDVEREGKWYGKWPGAVRPKFEWHNEVLQESL